MFPSAQTSTFSSSSSGPYVVGSANTDAQREEIEYQLLKQRIHQSLIESLDLMSAKGQTQEQLQQQVQPFIDQHVANESARSSMPDAVQSRLKAELPDEMFGAGPLEALMNDPSIADILVNHPHEIFIERNGLLERSHVIFADEAHLLRIIRRIAANVGRRIDEVSPMVDARLEDGSRVNAVIPPLALDGPKLSIRRFGHGHLHLDKLVSNQTLSQPMANFLKCIVAGRNSIMIAGGTGSGKTTMLNALSAFVPYSERIVTIEDSAELRLQHPHVARLETRPANSEGAGEFSQRDLVKNALRMRPDRIIVGEIRGEESLDMLQAMNTGHEGSLTTIHANDTMDALARLEMMVAMTGLNLPTKVVRSYITSGIHFVIHVARLKGGVRKLTRISELEKSFDGELKLNDVFKFQSTGTNEAGQVIGKFESTGHRPACMDRLAEHAIDFDDAWFKPSPREDR